MASVEQQPPLRPSLCGAGSYGALFALNKVLVVKIARQARDLCVEEIIREQEAYDVVGNKSPYLLALIHQVPREAIFFHRVRETLQAVFKFTNYAFEQDRADRWMGQICGGMAFLESQGYGHCDMRPDNIMVDDNDNIRIIDLGSMARIGDELVVGTEPFARQLTPEELDMAGIDKDCTYGVAGARFELFALGSVWYSILRGHYPTQELYDKHIMLEIQKTYREKQFPPLAVDTDTEADAETQDTANDRIVYKCWHNQYASVAELETVFRNRKDGTEWYRFDGETDSWIAERRQECVQWVEGGGLATIDNPWAKKAQEKKPQEKKPQE